MQFPDKIIFNRRIDEADNLSSPIAVDLNFKYCTILST